MIATLYGNMQGTGFGLQAIYQLYEKAVRRGRPFLLEIYLRLMESNKRMPLPIASVMGTIESAKIF